MQRLTAKSLDKDVRYINDSVVMLMAANYFRPKMPEYVRNDTGFLIHTLDDISLAKLADKLICSKALNSGNISNIQVRSSVELNALSEMMDKKINNFQTKWNFKNDKNSKYNKYNNSKDNNRDAKKVMKCF